MDGDGIVMMMITMKRMEHFGMAISLILWREFERLVAEEQLNRLNA